MQPDPCLWGEVNAVCAVGDIVGGEEDAASEFEIRNRTMERGEVVFQIERREADAIRVLLLDDVVNRNEVERIFQVSFWRLEQHSSQPESRLKYSGIATSAGDAVSAGDEELSFVGAGWNLVRLGGETGERRDH